MTCVPHHHRYHLFMTLRRQFVSHDFLQMKIRSHFRQLTDTNEEATSISPRKLRDQGYANLHYFYFFFKKLMRVKFPLRTDNQVDVPSINHLSGWIEGLWIVFVYIGSGKAMPTSETTSFPGSFVFADSLWGGKAKGPGNEVASEKWWFRQ